MAGRLLAGDPAALAVGRLVRERALDAKRLRRPTALVRAGRPTAGRPRCRGRWRRRPESPRPRAGARRTRRSRADRLRRRGRRSSSPRGLPWQRSRRRRRAAAPVSRPTRTRSCRAGSAACRWWLRCPPRPRRARQRSTAARPRSTVPPAAARAHTDASTWFPSPPRSRASAPDSCRARAVVSAVPDRRTSASRSCRRRARAPPPASRALRCAPAARDAGPGPTVRPRRRPAPRARARRDRSATSTAIAFGSARAGSTNHQPTTVSSVTASTAQRKPTATRLAKSTSRGRSRPASSTSRCSAASVVASPRRVTSITIGWSRLTDPASSGAPAAFSIGVDSPVSHACEQLERPCTTTPSAGTVSPGGTSTRSPTRSFSARSSQSPATTETPRGAGRSGSTGAARLRCAHAPQRVHAPAASACPAPARRTS